MCKKLALIFNQEQHATVCRLKGALSKFAALQNRKTSNNANATHLCCDNVKQIGV